MVDTLLDGYTVRWMSREKRLKKSLKKSYNEFSSSVPIYLNNQPKLETVSSSPPWFHKHRTFCNPTRNKPEHAEMHGVKWQHPVKPAALQHNSRSFSPAAEYRGCGHMRTSPPPHLLQAVNGVPAGTVRHGGEGKRGEGNTEEYMDLRSWTQFSSLPRGQDLHQNHHPQHQTGELRQTLSLRLQTRALKHDLRERLGGEGEGGEGGKERER